MIQRLFLLFVFVVAVSSLAMPQADQPQPDAPNVPQVTFELTWRAANPQWFQIAIDSTGRASYQSQAHTGVNETPGDPYELKFTASQKLRNEVFNVAKDLDYFKSDLSFTGKQNIASTGDKVLSYTAEGKTTKAKFDYSPNPKAQQLAKLFQQMSATFELGRQLDYSLRFDKLGVDQRLKQLEELERSRSAPGLQVLVPTLERVLNDPTSMNMSRQRANFLIYAAKAEK
jgi:hypothetical protein